METMFSSVMKKALAGAFAMSLLAGHAGADKEAEVSLDVSYAGRYIWRGIPVNEEAVLQPSATLSGGGFSLNVWGNVDLTDWGEQAGYGDEQGNATEVDYTAGYGAGFGPMGFDLGFITYTFPNLHELGGGLSTTEVYLGVGLDLPLSPRVTTFLDVDDHGSEGASYTGLDLRHSLPLYESGGVSSSLDLSAGLGYANQDFIEAYYGLEEHGDFHDWRAGASLTLSWRGFYLSPGYSYASLMHEEAREHVKDAWNLDPESGYMFVGLGWDSELMNLRERI